MKHSFIVIFTILLGVFGLSSCNTYNIIEGSGIVQTEYRRMAYFNKIELYFPAEVIVRQGNTKDIEITAESNIIDLQVKQVITPVFKGMINFILHVRNDFLSQGKNFRLAFGGHESAYRSFHCSYKSLHQVAISEKFTDGDPL